MKNTTPKALLMGALITLSAVASLPQQASAQQATPRASLARTGSPSVEPWARPGSLSAEPWASTTATIGKVKASMDHSRAAASAAVHRRPTPVYSLRAGGPPPNDNCASAQTLTVQAPGGCLVGTAGDNSQATQSTTGPTCDPTSTGIYADVWYSFNSGVYSTININFDPGTMTDHVWVLYDACGGAELNCYVLPPLSEPIAVTPGTTYKLRVYSNTEFGLGGQFVICLEGVGGGTPPANDDCSGATTLTVNSSCVPTTGDVTDATQSIPAILCNTFTGDANDDVWYAFVATGTDATIEVQGSAGFDAVVDLRSGVCNGTNIFCADVTFDGGLEVINANGLSIGATYYVRVYHYATAAPTTTTFDICVYATPPAPPNDDCGDVSAVPLAIGASINFNGDNTGSTSINEGPFSANPTVWHAFTIPACANVTVAYCGTTPPFGNVWVSLSTDCPSTAFIDAISWNDTDCPDGNFTVLFENLAAGTYWLPVLRDGTATGPYTLEVSAVACAVAPANDDCGDAIALVVNAPGDCPANAVAGDNTTATSIDDPSCDATTVGFQDVWYTFNSGANSTIDVTLDWGTATDLFIEVLDACGGTPAFCDVLNPAPYSVPVSPGTDYVIRVFSNNQFGLGGVFNICLSGAGAPPPNDDCSSAIPVALPIGGSVNFNGDNTGSTSTGDAQPGTIMDIGGDTTTVWHAFTLADCADLAVSYCGTNPLPAVYWAVLATSCPADDDVIFFSSGNFTDCVDGNATIFFTNVPAGTYYLPVRGEPASWGPYSIEVSATACAAPPVNDDCADAIGLAVHVVGDCPLNSTAGNNANATQDAGDPSCDTTTGTYLDSWYTFYSGPNTTVTVHFDEGTMTDWVIVVYDACAGTEVAGSCMIQPTAPFDITVNTNTTYWIRVYSNTQYGLGGDYMICLEAALSTGVEALSQEGLTVFPNPNNGHLTISNHGFDGAVQLDVVDATGRIVHAMGLTVANSTVIDLDLSGKLVPGSYIVRLSDNARVTSQPVLVK